MINYIKANNLLSLTAAEIKVIADADRRTVNDVSAGDLQTLLADEGLLLYLGNAWTGSLLGAITEGPLLMGLVRLQAHLLQPDRQKVATTDQLHAAAFWGIVQAARTLVSDEASLMTKLNSMCGGRAAPSATVEEWQAALDQIEQEQTELLFSQRKINAVALFNERMLSGMDAADVMAQAWEDAGA